MHIAFHQTISLSVSTLAPRGGKEDVMNQQAVKRVKSISRTLRLARNVLIGVLALMEITGACPRASAFTIAY
jgi:hypothetical protein